MTTVTANRLKGSRVREGVLTQIHYDSRGGSRNDTHLRLLFLYRLLAVWGIKFDMGFQLDQRD